VTKRPVALVTGASRGIGRAIAERLAAENYDLTISARGQQALGDVAKELSRAGGQVNVVPADMAVESDIEALADAHIARFGRLHVLVTAAGVGMAGDLASFPVRRLDTQFAVNVRAPVVLVQRLLPLLRSTSESAPEYGVKIIALASITGVVSEPNLAAYGMTKAALISWCESITLAEGLNGVNATAISPGYTDTGMSAWVHDEIAPSTMIRKADVAELAIALCRLSRYAAVPNVVISRPGQRIWRA
jgi:3-oxoacyl-[acyl-carrier protein] reductase